MVVYPGMTTTPADIIENARKAKTFIACAGEGPIPDQLLLRAAVAYNMLARQVTGRSWQRGDLVLVDGTKEGCVLSVNGNVAQVSMWAARLRSKLRADAPR